MTNEELKQARDQHVPRGPFNVTNLFAAKAKNATITDVEGREYIDFASGIGVMAVGHCHPKVVAAVQDQADKFSHTCFHVVMYEAYIELAKKMNAAAPGSARRRRPCSPTRARKLWRTRSRSPATAPAETPSWPSRTRSTGARS